MIHIKILIKRRNDGVFPDGLVARIPGFRCHGPGSITGWESEIIQQ